MFPYQMLLMVTCLFIPVRSEDICRGWLLWTFSNLLIETTGWSKVNNIKQWRVWVDPDDTLLNLELNNHRVNHLELKDSKQYINHANYERPHIYTFAEYIIHLIRIASTQFSVKVTFLCQFSSDIQFVFSTNHLCCDIHTDIVLLNLKSSQTA